MEIVPRRQSLVSQTLSILREKIERGDWNGWLPGERSLCESLQVSRNTLRAALSELKREGVICSDHGTGNRVVGNHKTRASQTVSHLVGIISLDPVQRLRPTQALWIDDLRGLLSERGCRLHVFHGPQYFRTNPGAALTKLTSKQPHGCWILTLSTESTQRWFERNGIPCIVAGTVQSRLKLPFRDLDHRATCRHAAGIMLAQGHRKVALVIQKSQRAGDLESEAGFIEGVQQSPHANATAEICQHEGTVANIGVALRRLMHQSSPPSAMLVANAYHYLSVIGQLTQLGLRVPQDVSVVSRDEDPFLSFMVPEPARYTTSPHTMATALLAPVLQLLAGEVVTHRAIRIMPDFIRGDTLAKQRAEPLPLAHCPA